IRAALRTTTLTATAATKEIAEYITKDVGETCTTKAAATAHLRLDTGMAVLVIRLTLLCVAQDFISLGCFLEFVVGILVVRVSVGVILHRHAPVGFFNISLACAALYPKHFIKITF